MHFLNIMLPLIATIAIGYLCRRLGLFSASSVSVFNNFVYYVGLPALIIKSLQDMDLNILLDWRLFTVNLTVIALIIMVAFMSGVFMRSSQHMRPALMLGSFLGNVAFIGIPLTAFAFGPEVLPYSALIVALYVVVLFAFGIAILEKYSGTKHDEYKLYKSPVLIAVLVGIVLSPFHFPSFIENSISLLAATVTPIVLFSLGLFIVFESLKKEILRKELLILLFYKLALLPALAFFFGSLIGLGSIQLKVTVLMAAMPTGILDFVLASKFHTEQKFMADTVVASTILSFFTISVILWLL